MNGILVRELRRHFGALPVVDGVSFEVDRGEIVALVGPNGAGKSTVLRILGGTVLPSGGQALVGGHDIAREPDRARLVTSLVLGEDRAWYWRLTGRHNLEFHAALRGVRRQEARAQASGLLDAVGLTGAADQTVDKYSSGMRACLGVARGLLGSPSVLLLDEPTRSLDLGAAARVRCLIRRCARDQGGAVLFSTHDPNEAADLADRTLFLVSGRLQADASSQLCRAVG